MKKMLFLFCFSFTAIVYAQDIPVEEFSQYRDWADSLFNAKQYDESIKLYKMLAKSGDATAGYELYEIYSQGIGVKKDIYEANNWLDAAKEIENNNTSLRTDTNAGECFSIENILNECGTQIEHGAQLKNIAIPLGIAGGAVGGIIFAVGTSNGSDKLRIAGVATIGGFGIIALVIDALGNSYIKDAGRSLKKIKFSGNSINVNF